MSKPRCEIVVLDTNVCLDLFVFRDPRAQPLHDALRSGRLQAVTRADCRAEWRAVLAYPRLALNETAQQQAAADYDAFLQECSAPLADEPLPRCRDADDQKFLELAGAARATILFTRDAELLRLARRTAARFAILTPESWCAVHDSASA